MLHSNSVQGFEYWSDPDNPEDGFITWQSDGVPSYRLGANSVGPDMGVNGSMVGQRRIPEEPMVSDTVTWCSVSCADMSSL